MDRIAPTAEELMHVAYCSTSGDPAVSHVGIHGGSPAAEDSSGLRKIVTCYAAVQRELGYFERMREETDDGRRFPPSIRVWARKPGGGWRPIDGPSEIKRLYALVCKRHVEDIIEWALTRGQFGGRRYRNVIKACERAGATVLDHMVVAVHQLVRAGYFFALSLDLHDAFGLLPHKALIAALVGCGLSPVFARAILRLVRIDSVDRGGRAYRRYRRGIEQGNPMSSLLSNLVIACIFRELESLLDIAAFAYVDDIYILARDEVTARAAYEAFHRIGTSRGMRGIRPLAGNNGGGDDKASQIIDMRDSPLTMLRTYAVTPAAIGLTREKLDLLVAEIGRKGKTRISPNTICEMAGAAAISKRWMREAGLLRKGGGND